MAKIESKTINKIQELTKNGTKASRIAELLGVSVKAVRKYGRIRLELPNAVVVEGAKEITPKFEQQNLSPVVENNSEAPNIEAPKIEPPKLETPAATRLEIKQPKAPKDYAVLFGSHVTRQGIEAAAAGLEPRKVRKHAVVVAGKTFPVCQIVAAAASIPEDRKQFFTSEDAKRVLTQLHFDVVNSKRA